MYVLRVVNKKLHNKTLNEIYDLTIFFIYWSYVYRLLPLFIIRVPLHKNLGLT